MVSPADQMPVDEWFSRLTEDPAGTPPVPAVPPVPSAPAVPSAEERVPGGFDGTRTAGPATAFLTDLAERVTPPGIRPRLLELAVTPGSASLALSARGFDVASADPRRCAAGQIPGPNSPGGGSGRFDVVYAVNDELCRVTDQREQVRCVQRVASFLRPGGALVVQGSVPDQGYWADDRLDHEPAGQRVRVNCAVTGRLLNLRYIWPAELDLMGELAELALEDRWGGWHAEPFTGTTAHLSVFRN